jgi:hypothetical protein
MALWVYTVRINGLLRLGHIEADTRVDAAPKIVERYSTEGAVRVGMIRVPARSIEHAR